VYKKMYEREDLFWWHRGIRKIINALLDKYLLQKQGNKILDVGCGTGGMFKTLARYGEVYGIDKSSQAVGYAKARSLANLVVLSSADSIPFDDATFDVVTCFDVLYHKWVQDDSLVLKEIQRVLKPGGIMFVREASYNWLRSQHDELVWTNHRFTRDELSQKIKKAGFKIIKRSYVNFFLFPLALIKRISEKIIRKKNPLEHLFGGNFLVGNFFAFFLYLEAFFIRFIDFPFGLSIICIAKKE